MEEITYTPTLETRLRNQESLSRGTGCKYLYCIYGPGDGPNRVLICKKWCRKYPTYSVGAVVVFES